MGSVALAHIRPKNVALVDIQWCLFGMSLWDVPLMVALGFAMSRASDHQMSKTLGTPISGLSTQEQPCKLARTSACLQKNVSKYMRDVSVACPFFLTYSWLWQEVPPLEAADEYDS